VNRTNAASLVLPLVLILLLALGTACGLLRGTDGSAPAGALRDGDNATPIATDWSIPSAESESTVLPSIADVVTVVKPSVVAGRTFRVDPDTVASDPLNDLAVIKIDAENLPAADIGDASALRVGDWLVAIGNPLGLGIGAKEGIVSRLDVSLIVEGQTLDHLIETSAAINPGNSGGPLVNMKGEVIGIISAKVASVGVEGLGYAMSITEVIPVIEELTTGQ